MQLESKLAVTPGLSPPRHQEFNLWLDGEKLSLKLNIAKYLIIRNNSLRKGFLDLRHAALLEAASAANYKNLLQRNLSLRTF
ncbi:hypothetical protein BS627_02955 [Agrobacterium salinitolerans]|uniref:hypothetical protein n=1 Tax=Agrobacterium salinitolerans TaxID=1183413 RepID=UPI0009C91FCC|nr:hypothetical protein [Agrobacterium salinitolerans]OOO27696.1 hypothetical protein BS627_02955 [Agrobacterium salinitolerans]PNQ25596.1 hypothetical protein C2E26_03015 [Rhizobium sp. YIC5082]